MGENHSAGNEPNRGKGGKETLVISWWNGGGKLIPRIKANPELKKFLASEPDIFAYGESLAFKSTREMCITKYNSITHKAQHNGFRRGIVVYYKKKLNDNITKAGSSKRFDIIWLRMKNSTSEKIICFFYTLGVNHKEECREELYEELRKGIDKYKDKKIFLMGDSNARLGEYTGDININGNHTSNKNKTLFMGLLDYTGMILLNKIYTLGKPTYEIPGKKRSIIDVALTNTVRSVQTFEVMPQMLGANAQTGHKIIKLTLKVTTDRKDIERSKTEKFRHCTAEALTRVKGEVARKCKTLRFLRGNRTPSTYTYEVLSRLYHNAKIKCIGYRMGGRKKEPLSIAVKTQQVKLNQTADEINKVRKKEVEGRIKNESMALLIQRYQLQEKELYALWDREKNRRWADWTRKLNTLDYNRATRAFYWELNHRNEEPEMFGPIVNSKGELSTNLQQCLDNWRNFYKDLYSASKEMSTVEEHIESDSANPELNKKQEEDLDGEIKMNELVDALFALKPKKAAGVDSMLNDDLLELLDTSKEEENWKNVEILNFIHKMLNNLWESEKVPGKFKETTLRPFLKGTDKDPTIPGNYRPVSLLNVLMKLYEHIIKVRLTKFLEETNYFSTVQAAYRKGRSTLDHILAIQEIFYYYRYKMDGTGGSKGKKPIFLGIMDLVKAFDTVPRAKLFNKLRKTGVQGKMYRVIKNLYENNKATILIGGHRTKSLNIESGVMQGSKLGPILFNIYINDLLLKLQNSNLGVSVHRSRTTALGFADDIILIADTPSKLQAQIDICVNWSKLNGMKFNDGKNKCMVIPLNTGLKGLQFNLDGKNIEVTTMTKYLGVRLSRSRLTSLYGKHIREVLEKAEVRVNAIRHKGFKSDGLRPETTIRMYKTLVRPILEYASQVLSYKHYYFKDRKCEPIEEPMGMIKRIEKFQNKVLKKIVPCPKKTPPAMVRLLTGTMPMEGRIDMLKLRYFWRLHHTSKEKDAKKIYLELRKRFLQSNVGYVHEIFNICCKYGRMDLWHGLCPDKISPLARIKRIVETFHLQKDLEVARKTRCIYTALTNFKAKKYTMDAMLRKLGRFQSAEHRSTFIFCLLDTSSFDRQCKHCGLEAKDITKHGMEDCSMLVKQRKLFRMMMHFYNVPKEVDLTNKAAVVQLALSKSCFLNEVCKFWVAIWKPDKETEQKLAERQVFSLSTL